MRRPRRRRSQLRELGGEISKVLDELGLDGAQRALTIAESWEQAVGLEIRLLDLQIAPRGPRHHRGQAALEGLLAAILMREPARHRKAISGATEAIHHAGPGVLKRWRGFALVIAAMVLLAATEPAMPALLEQVVARFEKNDVSGIPLLALAVVGLFMIRGIASYGSAIALASVASKLVRDLRAAMFDKLLAMPIAEYDRQESGRLVSKLTYDAAQVTEADLAQGRVYPPLENIRGVSAVIAASVAEVAYERGLARAERPNDILEHIRAHMYEPRYRSYV